MTDNPTPNDIALLREAAIRAALCLSGFIGEGVFVEGFEDPTDAWCRVAKAVGLPVSDDDDLRALLAPGQHHAAAGEGLTITDDEIDDAIAHGFGERFTERAQPATPKPSTEQAPGSFTGMFFPRVLNTQERQALEGVMAKYGTGDPAELLLKVLMNVEATGPADNLPDGHPYKHSTEQAPPSDSAMLQARFNEIMAEIETTGRCLLRKNDLGDLLAAASALAATPSGADALGDRL